MILWLIELDFHSTPLHSNSIQYIWYLKVIGGKYTKVQSMGFKWLKSWCSIKLESEDDYVYVSTPSNTIINYNHL